MAGAPQLVEDKLKEAEAMSAELQQKLDGEVESKKMLETKITEEVRMCGRLHLQAETRYEGTVHSSYPPCGSDVLG